jgi:hypothetical protein
MDAGPLLTPTMLLCAVFYAGANFEFLLSFWALFT